MNGHNLTESVIGKYWWIKTIIPLDIVLYLGLFSLSMNTAELKLATF